MDRRRFLQAAGLAGLSVMAPIGARSVRADSRRYKGPFWVMVNAGGGWDPTMLCDPKGGAAKDPTSVNQTYTPSQIGQAGNISYAPTSYSDNDVVVQTAQAFFEAHHDRLLVLNGVDTTTNNHDSGSRTVWSGQLAEGYPSFAALVAAHATAATPVPLAFLSNGGYDVTSGVISLTRVGSTDSIQKLAYTNIRDPNDAKSDTYHTPATASRIAAAQSGRIQSMAGKQTLPTLATSMNELYLARNSDDGLARLGEALKNTTPVTTSQFPDLDGTNLGDLQSLMRQAQLALVAFSAGVAVSANMDFGGFDTHSNHDQNQGRQMMVLMRGIDYLFKQIDAMGLTDQVYVMVGSDFGRTPYYNSGNGKDHWNITSVMLSGPKIPKDKVIGTTDKGFIPITVDPKTLKPSSTGVRIGTNNLHLSLRKLAGISGTPLEQQFPIPGDTLPLFG